MQQQPSGGKLLLLKRHPQTEISMLQNLSNLLSVSLAVKVLTVKVYNAKLKTLYPCQKAPNLLQGERNQSTVRCLSDVHDLPQ